MGFNGGYAVGEFLPPFRYVGADTTASPGEAGASDDPGVDGAGSPARAIPAVRWTAAGAEPVTCCVATETPVTLVANGRELVTVLATPQALRELTVGYLYTAGWIQAAIQVRDWRWDPCTGRMEAVIDPPLDFSRAGVWLADDGGGPDDAQPAPTDEERSVPPAPAPPVDARAVAVAGLWIAECSALFRESGGVHAAGLYDPLRGPLFFYEDVARHNAVDKVIGRALLDGVALDRLMLVRTGRTSSEIVAKAHQAGVPFIISRGAPTAPAVRRAWQAGITLVGFARGDAFTIYANPSRIDL